MDTWVWVLAGLASLGFLHSMMNKYRDSINEKAEAEKRARPAEIAAEQRYIMNQRFDELMNDPKRFNQYFKDKPAVSDKPLNPSPSFKQITKDTAPDYRTNKSDTLTDISTAVLATSLMNSNDSYSSNNDYSSSSSWDNSSSSSSWDSSSSSFDSGSSSSSGGSDW